MIKRDGRKAENQIIKHNEPERQKGNKKKQKQTVMKENKDNQDSQTI